MNSHEATAPNTNVPKRLFESIISPAPLYSRENITDAAKANLTSYYKNMDESENRDMLELEEKLNFSTQGVDQEEAVDDNLFFCKKRRK